MALTPEQAVAAAHRLWKEIDGELQTLAVAISRAPEETQNGLTQLYVKEVLFMAKQNRVFGNKISALQAARAAKSSTSVVQKRLLGLIAFEAKQLKPLSDRLHRLNLELAREYASKRGN